MVGLREVLSVKGRTSSGIAALAALLQSPPTPLRDRRRAHQQTQQRPRTSQLAIGRKRRGRCHDVSGLCKPEVTARSDPSFLGQYSRSVVSGGELGVQDVELLDRRFAEQFARLLAESSSDCAGQVRVAAGVIGKHVEDPK